MLSKTSIIQLVIILGIVSGYFFIDFNAISNSIQGEGEFITQDSRCDLHKTPCEIIIQDGTKYTLEVFPKHIPLMEKLTFKITTSKPQKDLTLKIYATNMYMGEFLFDLKPMHSLNSYQAIGTLPTCPIGNMKWNVDIAKNSLTQKIGARFQFETDR